MASAGALKFAALRGWKPMVGVVVVRAKAEPDLNFGLTVLVRQGCFSVQ